MRSWILVIFLMVLGMSTHAQKYYENFDKPQIEEPRPWRIEGYENDPKKVLSTDYSVSGGKSFKAYLPRQVYNVARHELRFEAGINGVPKYQTIRQTWGTAFAIYIPNNWKADYTAREVIMQYHGKPDAVDTYKNPPISIYIDGDRFTGVHRHYTGNPQTPENQVNKNFSFGTVTPGKWHFFVLDVHWDYRSNGNGFMKLYMRKGSKPSKSDLKYNYSGPIGPNDENGPYFKLGIYKFEWKKEEEVALAKKNGIDYRLYYFDDVTVQKGAILTGSTSSNSSPSVTISGNSNLTLPSNATTLTANASDSDGSISSYSWSKVSGPSVSMSGRNSSRLSLSGMVAGTYKFQVKVTDNDGATSTATRTVTVNSSSSGGSDGPGSGDGKVYAGADFSIDVAEKNFNLVPTWDESLTVKNITWRKVSGPNCGILEKSNGKIHVHGIRVGTYVFEVKLVDVKNKAYTDRITVKVTDGPPSSDSGSSTSTLSVNAGKDMTVPVTDKNFNLVPTWDNSINVVDIKWEKISGPNCGILEKNYGKIHVHGIRIGTYVFEVTIKNDKGQTGSDRIKINVISTSSMASIAGEFPGIPVRNFVSKEDSVSLVDVENAKMKVNLRNVNGVEVSMETVDGEINTEVLRTGLYQYDVVEGDGEVVQKGTILIY